MRVVTFLQSKAEEEEEDEDAGRDTCDCPLDGGKNVFILALYDLNSVCFVDPEGRCLYISRDQLKTMY